MDNESKSVSFQAPNGMNYERGNSQRTLALALSDMAIMNNCLSDLLPKIEYMNLEEAVVYDDCNRPSSRLTCTSQ